MSQDSVTTPEDMEFITRVENMNTLLNDICTYADKLKDVRLEDLKLPESVTEKDVKDAVEQIKKFRDQFDKEVLKETEAEVNKALGEFGRVRDELKEELESREQAKLQAGPSGQKPK